MEQVQYDDRTVVVAHVPGGLEATYSLSGRFKIREGSFNRLMSPADVLGHAVQRGSLDYERTPVRQAKLDDLSEQKVKDFLVQRLRTSVPDRPLDKLLQDIGAASLELDTWRPTVAGLLFFADWPQFYLSHTTILAARLVGPRGIHGEGDFKYLKSGTCGPAFACSVNESQPCGWGANKAMRALLAVPPDRRTPVIEQAIQAGAEFLLSRDPAVADYPYTTRVSSTWFKFGFPLSYWSDVLETTAVLVEAGYGSDPRLANALQLILSKQDDRGRWKLENSLNGKMWADIEEKGQPSKWITLRALRVLMKIERIIR